MAQLRSSQRSHYCTTIINGLVKPLPWSGYSSSLLCALRPSAPSNGCLFSNCELGPRTGLVVAGNIADQEIFPGLERDCQRSRVAGVEFRDLALVAGPVLVDPVLVLDIGQGLGRVLSTRGKRPGRGELTRLRRTGPDPTCPRHVGFEADQPFRPAAR